MEIFVSQIVSIIDDFEKSSSAVGEAFAKNQNIPNSEGSTSQPVEDSEENKSSLAKEVFLQEIERYLIEIYKLLNYSLLSGEYIYNENIKADLENIIENKLSSLFSSTDSFEAELQNKILEFITAVKIGCSNYSVFINNVENEYSYDKVDYLFTFSQLIRKEINNTSLSSNTNNLFTYFRYNVQLSLADHFFSSDDTQFMRLFEIENSIDEVELIDFESITKVIKFKIGFLEHKWKARKQEENPSSIHYSIDGKTNILSEYITENKKIKEWSEIIDSHYQLYTQNWEHNIEKRIKPFKNKELKDLTYLELHQLIKYYKDVNKNISKLDEISKFISNKKSNEMKNYYDRYALNIISNYSLNNWFSLFLEKNESIANIKDFYLKTKSKLKGEVNNFFLEYKYLHRLIDILNNKIEEISNIKFLEQYENLISNECKIALEEYALNVEWSKKNDNYIFLLPFEECKVNIDEFKIEKLPFIFMASSFVLPTVHNNIEKQYTEIKQKIRSFTFQIGAIKRIRKDLDEIKELRSEIDKRDFKSIEIISIFTAIITFVLSSIPAFKFVDSVWEALLFMLSLASSLGIFILLILFSTRGFKNNWIGIVYVAILAIISLTGYNALTNFEKKQINIDKRTESKIDSLLIKKINEKK